MSILLGLTILNSGVPLSMVCAAIGLAFAFCLIAVVIRAPSGTERIARDLGRRAGRRQGLFESASQDYQRHRSGHFHLAFLFKDHPTAIDRSRRFLFACGGLHWHARSRSANVRTAQAASVGRLNALRMGFTAGSVTGLLVVGLGVLSVPIFYTVAAKLIGSDCDTQLVGLALGGSLISVFRSGAVRHFTPKRLM